MTPCHSPSATNPSSSAGETCARCGTFSDSLLFSEVGRLCEHCQSDLEVATLKTQGRRYQHQAGVLGIVIGVLFLLAAAYVLGMVFEASALGVSYRGGARLLVLLGIGGCVSLFAGVGSVRAARRASV